VVQTRAAIHRTGPKTPGHIPAARVIFNRQIRGSKRAAMDEVIVVSFSRRIGTRTGSPAPPTAKGTTASTGDSGGEWIEVSKWLPRRFPAGSSKVPRTTSLYEPRRHGALGVNVQVLSPFVSWARPATRRSRTSAIAR